MSSDALRNSREAALEALPEHVPAVVQEALREAKQRLQETYGERLRRVILYGSQARGEAHEDSDVDLLVVLRGPIENHYQELKRAGDFWGEFLSRYGLYFSVQPFTEEAYEDLRRPFMQSIHEEGIKL